MDAQKQCDSFNEKYSVGTKGWLHLDSGERKATHTISKAQIMCDEAVIWVKGVSGCYLLERFEPAY